MKVSVNGKSSEYSGPPVLGELLRSLGIDSRHVAVERNMKVISRNMLESEPVEPGDEFEIIRLVGGG